MLNNDDYPFKPRGIVKWHAFAALINGEEQKEAAIETTSLDITLLDDKLDELNYTLNEAIIHNEKIRINYINDSLIEICEGIITNIDDINNFIQIDDNKININQIIDIYII